jgi:hypothetical protein
MSILIQQEEIHELIAKFEVCNVKYQQYLERLKRSDSRSHPIDDLHMPNLKPDSKNEVGWRKDKTGRCLMGQQYLWALLNWLTDYPSVDASDYFNNNLSRQVLYWLGDKNPEKEKIVRLLIAGMTSDWYSYKRLQHGIKNKKLKYEISRIDIFNYTFPDYLDNLIINIGDIKPDMEPGEYGKVTTDTKTIIEDEFIVLCNYLKSKNFSIDHLNLSKNEVLQLWLIASLTKSLKGKVGLAGLLNELMN